MFDPQVYFDKAMENGRLSNEVLALAKASMAYDIYTVVNAAYLAGVDTGMKHMATTLADEVPGYDELLQNIKEGES